MITITKITTKVYEFDYDKELKRLRDCFKGKQLKRQLDILNTIFIDKDIKKAVDLVDKLPYCPKEECSEEEFCGAWYGIFFGGYGEGSLIKGWNSTYKIEP
jgi:hypothetical protein